MFEIGGLSMQSMVFQDRSHCKTGSAVQELDPTEHWNSGRCNKLPLIRSPAGSYFGLGTLQVHGDFSSNLPAFPSESHCVE